MKGKARALRAYPSLNMLSFGTRRYTSVSIVVAEGNDAILAPSFWTSSKTTVQLARTPRRGPRDEADYAREVEGGRRGRAGSDSYKSRRGLRSTSHLCNNGADNGQRASSVSLKHALNSREPTNWLKPRERPAGTNLPLQPLSPPPRPPLLSLASR